MKKKKKDKDYVTYLPGILIFLAPKKKKKLKNALWAEKSVKTNVFCEVTLTMYWVL